MSLQHGSPQRHTPIAEGDVVAERYVVRRLLGSGGMGVVYEAEDLLLKERVALKMIRSDQLSEPSANERFIREIQLARRVTHPNVSRIFDVGIHRSGEVSLPFLTMELLHGETLKDRLAREGRLDREEILAFVDAIASGLAAAHAAGVVHRDLKPSNIMLVTTPQKRVVITDFGLAYAAGEWERSANTEIIGSPAYMAPEQALGEAVTPATDVYALGLVLYEMTTGVLPFIGDSTSSTMLKRLEQPPVLPRFHRRDIDPHWENVILSCLIRDPAARIRDITAVPKALRGETAAPPRPSRPRKWLPALVVIASMSAGAVPFLLRPRTVQVAPGQQVAVLGVRNLSGDPSSASIGAAITEMLAAELAATQQWAVVSAESVAHARRELSLGDEPIDAPMLARLGTLLGSKYALSGSYSPFGENTRRIRIDLRLQDSASGETLAELSETGNEQDLPDVVSRLADELRRRLEFSEPSPDQRASIRALQPVRSDALRHYSQGVSLLRLDACAAARGPLEAAVAAEPNFPLARSALAQSLACLGYDTQARTEGRRAVELSDDLAPEIRLETEAELAEITGDHARAAGLYRELVEKFPDHARHKMSLAQTLIAADKLDEARKLITELEGLSLPEADALELQFLAAYADGSDHWNVDDPRLQRSVERFEALKNRAHEAGARLFSARAMVEQAGFLNRLGDHQRALTTAREAMHYYQAASHNEGVLAAMLQMARALQATGDRAGARALMSSAADVADQLQATRGFSTIQRHVAWLLRAKGDLRDAERVFESSRSWNEERGRFAEAAFDLSFLADTQLAAGNLRQATASATRGLALSDVPEKYTIRLGDMVALAALYSGDVAEARAIYDRQPRSPAHDQRLDVLLAYAEGDLAAAERNAAAFLKQTPPERGPYPLHVAALRAMILVEQGRRSEARAELDRLEPLQKNGDFVETRRALDVARALLDRDAAAAEKMASCASESEATGYVVDSFWCRLAEARLKRLKLDQFALDAERRGLAFFARLARRE